MKKKKRMYVYRSIRAGINVYVHIYREREREVRGLRHLLRGREEAGSQVSVAVKLSIVR